jgi:beta-lactam-binding protein with PASTA domain
MHIALVLVFVVLVVFLTMQWLHMYTMHGKSIEVPDVKGYRLSELGTVLANEDMIYEVTDSIYSDDHLPGTVVSQNPESGEQVKKGRTVYVTINGTVPQKVEIPDLEGKSKRIAIPILEISGLKLEALKYRPDETCTDCVVGLEYRGREISPGEEVRKGEAVTLVLGQQSEVPTTVPDLLGLTYREAAELINAYSLNVGSIITCSGCETAEDSSGAFVVNHRPERKAEVNLGTFVDLFLTTDTTIANALRNPSDTTQYETN